MLKRIRAAMGQRDEKHQLSGVIDLTIPTLAGQQWGGNGGVAQKKQRFLWHYPWANQAIRSISRWWSHQTSSGHPSKNLPDPRLPRAAQSAVTATVATSQRWRDTPTSTSLTIPTPACCTGYTSWLAMPKRSSWEPNTVCTKKAYNHIWTSTASALAAALSTPLSWSAWSWPLGHLSGWTKGITTLE